MAAEREVSVGPNQPSPASGGEREDVEEHAEPASGLVWASVPQEVRPIVRVPHGGTPPQDAPRVGDDAALLAQEGGRAEQAGPALVSPEEPQRTGGPLTAPVVGEGQDDSPAPATRR